MMNFFHNNRNEVLYLWAGNILYYGYCSTEPLNYKPSSTTTLSLKLSQRKWTRKGWLKPIHVAGWGGPYKYKWALERKVIEIKVVYTSMKLTPSGLMNINLKISSRRLIEDPSGVENSMAGRGKRHHFKFLAISFQVNLSSADPKFINGLSSVVNGESSLVRANMQVPGRLYRLPEHEIKLDCSTRCSILTNAHTVQNRWRNNNIQNIVVSDCYQKYPDR